MNKQKQRKNSDSKLKEYDDIILKSCISDIKYKCCLF